MNTATHSKNSAGIIIAFVCAFSIGYGILRYHIVGTVPWKDVPFFTLNKGLSLAAYILLIFNFSFGPLSNLGVKVPEGFLNARKTLGMTGFLLAIVHVFMSFLLFNPAVYPNFFDQNGTLTFIAGMSMLGGILSFVVLWGYNMSFQTQLREDKAFIHFITSRNFLLLSGLFGLAHLFFMGFKGWLNPSAWPGGLPPISLIGFVIFTIGYVINLMGRK